MAGFSKSIVISGFLVLGIGCSRTVTVEAETGEQVDAVAAAERIQDAAQSEIVLVRSDNRTTLNFEGTSSVIESRAVSLQEDYLFDAANNLLLDFEGNPVCELSEKTFTISSIDSSDDVLMVTVEQAPEIDVNPEKLDEVSVLPAAPIETNCATGESAVLDIPDTISTDNGVAEYGNKSFTVKQETDSSVSVSDETNRVIIEGQISGVSFSPNGETMLYRKGNSIEAIDTETSSIKWSKKHGVGWHTALENVAVVSALEIDILTEPLQETTDVLIVDLETGETIDQFDFQGALVGVR